MNFELPKILTKWLPGESVFSLASRFHLVCGNASASRTCRLLFGHHRHGLAHDFPSNLDEFARRVEGALGTVEDIASRRTLLAYYWPFLSQARREAAVAQMRGQGIGSLKFSLGLLTSRFRANHPLKACPVCMQLDVAEHHLAYWHHVHQWPGIWVCPRHGAPLQMSVLKATGVQRFGWVLPRSAMLESVDVPSEAVPALARLGLFTHCAIGSQPVPAFDQRSLALACRVGLAHAGYVRSSGRLDLPRAADALVDHCRPLRCVQELGALPADRAAALQCLYRAVNEGRSLSHPIWHLALASWLFDSAAAWGDAMGGQFEQFSEERPVRNGARPQLSSSTQLVLLNASSARAAAAQLGIDVTTAMAWAADIGVRFERRPKILKGELADRLRAGLATGQDPGGLALSLGVSQGAVARFLRTEPGLRESWKSACLCRARDEARSRWTDLASVNPGSGVQALRTVEPATYAWLYRNDAVWLHAFASQRKTSARQESRPRVNWDVRDRQLANEVERVVLAITKVQPNCAIKLWQLYQRIPQLKAKLTKLDRMPMTLKAVLCATRASPRNALLPSLLDAGFDTGGIQVAKNANQKGTPSRSK